MEPCSNNVEEYNTLLISLQLAHEMRVRYLEVYGDLKLIINQVKGEYEFWHDDLVPYHHAVIKWPIHLMAFISVMCPDSKILRPTPWLH